MTTDALFPAEPYAVVLVPRDRLSAQRRRTLRQRAALAGGAHPLGLAFGIHLGLHAQAAPADDVAASGRRCGNCRFREVLRWHEQTYPKCLQDWHGEGEPPWATHGPGTDVRAWWPGCREHEYGDPKLSPDAARHVPEED